MKERIPSNSVIADERVTCDRAYTFLNPPFFIEYKNGTTRYHEVLKIRAYLIITPLYCLPGRQASLACLVAAISYSLELALTYYYHLMNSR